MKTQTKIKCNGCKKFFKNDFCDINDNFNILKDTKNNPQKLCYNCLEKFHKQNSKDERILKYGDKSPTNLSQHKHIYI